MNPTSLGRLTAPLAATLIFAVGPLSAAAQLADPTARIAPEWQPVREVVFNSMTFTSTGSAKDRSLMAKLWADQLSGAQWTRSGESLPSFALVATVKRQGLDYVLTMFNRAGPGTECEMPGNGAAVHDLHAICPLRVVQMQDGKVLASRSFPDYCMLAGLVDSGPTARSLNHMEFAYDVHAGLLRLRTIEHGRVVAACSRSVRLP